MLGGQARKSTFVNFPYEGRTVLAEPVNGPIFNALNDAWIYFDFFFQNYNFMVLSVFAINSRISSRPVRRSDEVTK